MATDHTIFVAKVLRVVGPPGPHEHVRTKVSDRAVLCSIEAASRWLEDEYAERCPKKLPRRRCYEVTFGRTIFRVRPEAVCHLIPNPEYKRGRSPRDVYVAIVEDASGLGGPMGSERICTISRRLFHDVETACQYLRNSYPAYKEEIPKAKCFTEDVGAYIFTVVKERIG